MKNTTKRTLRNALVGGLTTLASVAGLGGNTGCSQFSSVYAPNPISSTVKQRRLFEVGQRIESELKSGKPYDFDESTHTLYVRAENFEETLTKYGLKNTHTYDELFEGTRLEVKYTDPKTRIEKVITPVLANDGTIDTEFGSFNAFKTRSALDNEMTSAARKAFGSPNLELQINQIAYPYAEKADTFLGYATVVNPWGLAVTTLLAAPMDMQGISTALSLADCKYLIGVKQINNLGSSMDDGTKITTKHDANYVQRVIVMGETGKFGSHFYPRVKVGDRDVLIGLGNRPLDNFQATVGEVAETVEQLERVTGGVIGVYSDVDSLGHEQYFLPSRTGRFARKKPNELKRFNNNVQDVQNAFDGITGLSDKVTTRVMNPQKPLKQ